MLKYHPPEIINCLRKRCLCCNKVSLSKISLTRLKNKRNKKLVLTIKIKVKKLATMAAFGFDKNVSNLYVDKHITTYFKKTFSLTHLHQRNKHLCNPSSQHCQYVWDMDDQIQLGKYGKSIKRCTGTSNRIYLLTIVKLKDPFQTRNLETHFLHTWINLRLSVLLFVFV
jgi:hypothetical protein